MTATDLRINDRVTIDRAQLDLMFAALRDEGCRLVGPTARNGAIVYDELVSTADLPAGWIDDQGAGTYRAEQSGEPALFDFTVGQTSWKRFLHQPALRLLTASRTEDGIRLAGAAQEPGKLAFIGVRSCDLHAIAILDRVLTGDRFLDTNYRVRRKNTFVIVVQCARAGGTCFCASMGTGPKASSGFDLALTEVIDSARHYFVAEIGSEVGADLIGRIAGGRSSADEIRCAEGRVAGAAASMGRVLDVSNIKELLYRSYEHPRWDAVARRCLCCANCTMVCPTCFCTTVEDVTDLAGDGAERWRRWDSCFTADFSYIHGGSVRSSDKARYRQWLVHKLATWIDQFGTSGCVGCGRCITWCPVGIDLTEDVQAIREHQSPTSSFVIDKETEDGDS
jgi:sulfhydrogenase subunit beta (sulfur reductase)